MRGPSAAAGMSLGDLSAKYTRGPAGGSASAVNLAELGIKEEPSRDSEASSGQSSTRKSRLPTSSALWKKRGGRPKGRLAEP